MEMVEIYTLMAGSTEIFTALRTLDYVDCRITYGKGTYIRRK